MILFQCDRCGFSSKVYGLATNHLAFTHRNFSQRKFEQLIPQLCSLDVIDVCENCFSEIQSHRAQLVEEKCETIFETVQKYISETKTI